MKLSRFFVTGLALAVASILSVGTILADAKPAPSGKINLNTATAEQLSAVLGVRPKLGARIVEHRQEGASGQTDDHADQDGNVGDHRRASSSPEIV